MSELVTAKRADRDNIAISNDPTKKKSVRAYLNTMTSIVPLRRRSERLHGWGCPRLALTTQASPFSNTNLRETLHPGLRKRLFAAALRSIRRHTWHGTCSILGTGTGY